MRQATTAVLAVAEVRTLVLLLVLVLLLASSGAAIAAPPSLEVLFPPGGQRGQTVAVAAEGSFSHWPIKVWTGDTEIHVRPLPEKGKLAIAVDPAARVGVHWLRLYDDEGATALRPFLVGTLREVVETEPNDDPLKPQRMEAACVTVNGRLSRNGDVDGFSVPLKKGQTLVAALEANRRLGAPMDGLLQVVSPAGFVLAENDDAPDRDPLIIFDAPADGVYLVRTFAFPLEPDARIGFSGGSAFVYRLTLTTQGFIDHLYPQSVSRAAPGRVEVAGWNIDSSARWLEVVPNDQDADAVSLDHPLLANGEEVRLEAHPVLVEQEPNPPEAAQEIVPPVTITGRIDPPRDQDAYQFRARKGEKWELRLESRSLGHPLDGVLRVLDATGKVVSEVDDPGGRGRGRRRSAGASATATRDPALTFTPAADATYRIVVRDLNGQGSLRHVYRLAVAPPVPDFALSLAADRFTLKPGQPLKIPVTVARDDGFPGAIDIAATGLPETVTATAVTSAPSGPSAKTVTLALCAHEGPWSGPIQIVGLLPEPGRKPNAASVPLTGFTATTEHLWLTILAPEPGAKASGADPKPKQR